MRNSRYAREGSVIYKALCGESILQSNGGNELNEHIEHCEICKLLEKIIISTNIDISNEIYREFLIRSYVNEKTGNKHTLEERILNSFYRKMQNYETLRKSQKD